MQPPVFKALGPSSCAVVLQECQVAVDWGEVLGIERRAVQKRPGPFIRSSTQMFVFIEDSALQALSEALRTKW